MSRWAQAALCTGVFRLSVYGVRITVIVLRWNCFNNQQRFRLLLYCYCFCIAVLSHAVRRIAIPFFGSIDMLPPNLTVMCVHVIRICQIVGFLLLLLASMKIEGEQYFIVLFCLLEMCRTTAPGSFKNDGWRRLKTAI